MAVVESKSKFLLDDETIKACFAKAGITGITSIGTLGAGEYNAVYEVVADKPYVMKIAPDPKRVTQIYERDMMKSEVHWYNVVRENTNIPMPEVYYSDFSQEVIPTDWFIMEKIGGCQMDEVEKETEQEQDEAIRETVKILAGIHSIHNDKFGYIQSGLYDDWYQALRAMICNLMEDGRVMGYESERGKKYLEYVDHYKEVYAKAECCLTSFDLWESNIMCEKTPEGLFGTWIDPERCFWGDRIMDLVTWSFGDGLEGMAKQLEVYNSVAELPILPSKETEIRFAAAMATMGLIMEIENYYRYTPELPGWARNVGASGFLLGKAFAIYEKYIND